MSAHHWLSTDSGAQCYACGIVLDYGERNESSGVVILTGRTMAEEAAALDLCPPCAWADRAHHYVLEGTPSGAYVLVCAYGDSTVGEDTEYATIHPECIGG